MKAVIFLAWAIIVLFFREKEGFDSIFEVLAFGIISMVMLYYVFG